MHLPQIRTQSTYARIELNTTRDHLQIQQQPAQMSIEQPPAEMYVNRVPSRLTIDQTRAWEELGLKSAPRQIEEDAQRGYQDLLQGIARSAQEGDEMMMIENGGGAIITQAERNSQSPVYDYNIGFIPSFGSVRINYDPGTLNFNWNVRKPIIDVNVNRPIMQYSPGRVDVSLRNHASLNIDFEV